MLLLCRSAGSSLEHCFEGIVQEMMRHSLYHIKWYFARTDLNTVKGKAENKKSIVKYAKWYTPEKEKQYPTSFKVDFVGQPYEGACAFYM